MGPEDGLGPSDDGPTLKTVITGILNAVVLSAQCSALPLRRGQISLNIISTMGIPCLGPEGHKWAAFCEFKTYRVFYLAPGVLYTISWYIWTTLLRLTTLRPKFNNKHDAVIK